MGAHTWEQTERCVLHKETLLFRFSSPNLGLHFTEPPHLALHRVPAQKMFPFYTATHLPQIPAPGLGAAPPEAALQVSLQVIFHFLLIFQSQESYPQAQAPHHIGSRNTKQEELWDHLSMTPTSPFSRKEKKKLVKYYFP